jgi:hypothetical protein
MKNTVKILGILAFIALFAFSFITCSEDAGDPKDLKLEGLSSYNGKYVFGWIYSDVDQFYACEDVDDSGTEGRGAKIDGGKAELTVYKTMGGKEVYKGSGTKTGNFYITNSPEFTRGLVGFDASIFTVIYYKSVTFENGIATVKFD